MTSKKVDVLVSGAGPVGLLFAYQMASRGHSVYCVDRKSGPTEQSRALLISSRSLEILYNKDLVADILYDAYIQTGNNVYSNGELIGSFESNCDTTFPQLTSATQSSIEALFYRRLLEDTDCKVHWETELVSYTQDDNGVRSIVRNIKTEKKHVIESSYIVGADGTRSGVRRKTPGWTYDGLAFATKFMIADISIHCENIDQMVDRMSIFMKGPNILALIRHNPLHKTDDDEHRFRLFCNMEEYKLSDEAKETINHGLDNSNEEPPSLEFIQEWVDKMAAPFTIRVSNPVWTSFFRVNERMANGYRRKRAFVMGDAAHCHSPVGGQGMNLGLQDADNLAWKMSSVLKGEITDPENLLDSYGTEREPRARNTIKATGRASSELFSSSVFNFLRTTVISVASKVPRLKQYAFNNLMQLTTVIDPSESNILGTSDKDMLQPGQFLPDTCTLRRGFAIQHKPKRIERFTLHEVLIGNQQLAVIYVGTCFARTNPNTDLMSQFWTEARKYPVRPLVIQSAWHSHTMRSLPEYIASGDELLAEDSFYVEERIDLPDSVTNRVGLYPLINSMFATQSPPSVVLFVRPDLYIAQARLVTNADELKAAMGYLEKHLKPL